MITDAQTNFVYLADKLISVHPVFANDLISLFIKFGIKHGLLPNTKDIWARDFMPIQVSINRFIEYRYDPDYLQGDTDDEETRELKTYPDIVCDSISLKTKKTDIILDGGNIVKSSNSIILTDKIVWENQRCYSEKQLLNKLHELFEVEKIVLIPWDEKCDFGHADGMLRFINDDTVLVSGFYETADSRLKKQLLSALKNENLHCEWLRCSRNEIESNLTYINFLQTKDLILIPKLNRVEDTIAFNQISEYFPDYSNNNRIAQVDMTEIVKFGGALNCITWTIKE